MEAEHTPGPWRTTEDGRVTGLPDVMIAPGRTIAVVGRSDREAYYNSRLIAAAPELLEALEGMEWAFFVAGDCKDQQQREQEDAAVDRARAAIAKAKGQDISDTE